MVAGLGDFISVLYNIYTIDETQSRLSYRSDAKRLFTRGQCLQLLADLSFYARVWRDFVLKDRRLRLATLPQAVCGKYLSRA